MLTLLHGLFGVGLLSLNRHAFLAFVLLFVDMLYFSPVVDIMFSDADTEASQEQPGTGTVRVQVLGMHPYNYVV